MGSAKTDPAKERMKLILEYPSIRVDRPARATAVCNVFRETPTQYIVKSENVRILQSSGVVFGDKEIRFRKDSGKMVGSRTFTKSWRIVDVIND